MIFFNCHSQKLTGKNSIIEKRIEIQTKTLQHYTSHTRTTHAQNFNGLHYNTLKDIWDNVGTTNQYLRLAEEHQAITNDFQIIHG